MKLHINTLIISMVAASLFFAKSGLSADPEQSLRFYTSGALINALSLPLDGFGYTKVFRPKNRSFATNDLATLIVNAAGQMAKAFPNNERLQIGDVANQRGGSIGQHKSHQNGLDADIVYFRKNKKEQDPMWMGKYAEKFVVKGKVSANFDTQRNWAILTYLAAHPQVERVFVDLAIKKNFCNLYAKNADPLIQQTLRTLRPAALHDDHFHLRIKCPPTSKRCTPQPPPPAGNGCGQRDLEMDMLNIDSEFGC